MLNDIKSINNSNYFVQKPIDFKSIDLFKESINPIFIISFKLTSNDGKNSYRMKLIILLKDFLQECMEKKLKMISKLV